MAASLADSACSVGSSTLDHVAASQTILLAWLLSLDRILVAEARAKLKPLAPRPLATRSLPEPLQDQRIAGLSGCGRAGSADPG